MSRVSVRLVTPERVDTGSRGGGASLELWVLLTDTRHVVELLQQRLWKSEQLGGLHGVKVVQEVQFDRS